MDRPTPDRRRRAKGPQVADMRTCIGSAKFGIEAHEAPIGDFPAQPSQKDGLGRMCNPHWNQYTKELRKAALARKGDGGGRRCGGADRAGPGGGRERRGGRRQHARKARAAKPEPIRTRTPARAPGRPHRRLAPRATPDSAAAIGAPSGPGREPGALSRWVSSMGVRALIAARGPTVAPTGDQPWSCEAGRAAPEPHRARHATLLTGRSSAPRTSSCTSAGRVSPFWTTRTISSRIARSAWRRVSDASHDDQVRSTSRSIGMPSRWSSSSQRSSVHPRARPSPLPVHLSNPDQRASPFQNPKTRTTPSTNGFRHRRLYLYGLVRRKMCEVPVPDRGRVVPALDREVADHPRQFGAATLEDPQQADGHELLGHSLQVALSPCGSGVGHDRRGERRRTPHEKAGIVSSRREPEVGEQRRRGQRAGDVVGEGLRPEKSRPRRHPRRRVARRHRARTWRGSVAHATYHARLSSSDSGRVPKAPWGYHAREPGGGRERLAGPASISREPQTMGSQIVASITSFMSVLLQGAARS